MQAVKTAISMEKNLFDQAEVLARSMNVSRSRLFVLAVQEFIGRQNNREMLVRINAACSEGTDQSEPTHLRRAAQRRLVEGEW